MGHTWMNWKEAGPSSEVFRDDNSLLSRLRLRETGCGALGAAIHRERALYQNVVPNSHVASVQPPRPCYVKGFSPCGRYLVLFARDLDRVLVYEYTGVPSWTAVGDSTQSEVRFEHMFRHLYDVKPAGLSIVVHRMAMFFHGTIMVISWEKPSDSGELVPLTAVSSVDLATGKLIDSVELLAEGIDLSLPHSISTYSSGKIVVLSPWSLTLLQVDRSGFFSQPQLIGKYCYPDDGDVINGVYNGEKLIDRTSQPSELQVYDTLKQRLLARMYVDGRRNSLDVSNAQTINTVSDGSTVSNPIGMFHQSAFFYYFRMVAETELTHVQFLDDERLLLNWGADYERSVSHMRMPEGIKAIYNIKTTRFEEVFPPFNQTNLNKFICQDPMTLANMRYPMGVWEQFAMDNGLRCHAAWMQRNIDSSDDNKNACLSIHRREDIQTSPYLDPELFQYDEKSISKDGHPVSAMRFRTAKFIANAWPSNLRFALHIEKCLHLSSVGRQQHNNNEYDITESIERRIHLLHLFHPYEPTVFCFVLTHDEYQGEVDVINVFTHT